MNHYPIIPNMNHRSGLTQFYNAQAERFHQTRKKHWPEFDEILKIVESYPKKLVRIIELGCGSGRLCSFLRANSTKKIVYTGVDISKNLITLAKQDHPDEHFVVGDMVTYLAKVKQESIDLVVYVASFQHLENWKERIFVLEESYRALVYGGKVIMTNRSFSKRFLGKHISPVLTSFIKRLFTLGNRERNSLMIPWKEQHTTYSRFYHIFVPSELESLFRQAGFVNEQCDYIDTSGQVTQRRMSSRNTLAVATKEIE